jgi:hypothetical protein
MLKAHKPDFLNYFNHKNDGGKKASCCAATGCKLLTSHGVANTYTFLMNTWNTPFQGYQQKVYKNTLATVKRQIQKAENPIPAAAISKEAAVVDNAILRDNMSHEVPLTEPEFGSTHLTIPMYDNCTDGELHSGMPGGSTDYEYPGDELDDRDVNPSPPAGTNGPRPDSRGLSWVQLMLMSMKSSMVMMRMQTRRKQHPMPMMDQHRM